jgi:RES domain
LPLHNLRLKGTTNFLLSQFKAGNKYYHNMSVDSKKIFDQVSPFITPDRFCFNSPKNSDDYFPDVLRFRLDDWLARYLKDACQVIDTNIPFANGDQNVTLTKCQSLIDGITQTVSQYYLGDILGATEIFNKTMDSGFKDISKLLVVPREKIFFRARPSDHDRHFDRKDLFHVPFERRNFVSTNRYSVPGFPALYLGDTTYVCWEEYDRQRLRDLTFARFQNNRPLRVIDINLFQEFHNDLVSEANPEKQLTQIMRYVCTFPLIIACTGPVAEKKGTFKPEYIIPQLLLQYVSQQPDVDGIKFPSTKVNYSHLFRVNAYNYVFPVKTNSKAGFCNKLTDTFLLTQPTSLELEEVINNPLHVGMVIGGNPAKNAPSIELVKGVKSIYNDTSFGKLENILMKRQLASIGA